MDRQNTLTMYPPKIRIDRLCWREISQAIAEVYIGKNFEELTHLGAITSIQIELP